MISLKKLSFDSNRKQSHEKYLFGHGVGVMVETELRLCLLYFIFGGHSLFMRSESND
jgi:hypothetical protein